MLTAGHSFILLENPVTSAAILERNHQYSLDERHTIEVPQEGMIWGAELATRRRRANGMPRLLSRCKVRSTLS